MTSAFLGDFSADSLCLKCAANSWNEPVLGEAMVNAQQEFSISLQQHFGVAVSCRDFVQGGQSLCDGFRRVVRDTEATRL
jgi:hypothetical protein